MRQAEMTDAEIDEFIEASNDGNLHLGADGDPLIRVSDHLDTQLAYEKMRHDGVSHNLAEMFALSRPPSIAGTDSIFMEGRCNGNQFEKAPDIGDLYAQEAKEAGVDITGKVYLHGLANYPGDPRAWVSSRNEVRKICEERGRSCEGAVKVKAPALDVEPAPAPAVAPDIVNAKVSGILDKMDPREARQVDVQDLREQVTEKIKPHWAK